ncbi:hypothetical protein NDU88_005246 [Pleurodeles waltl]|uniref:Uncharacterized protein n=1 Tax=Pleurodeles waltl TaxID=8319 RepID=A0AAV7PFD6_PLEWA|nr:hypothetical protein NDU88_005246 [Pleurodeles waltl]
MRLQAPPLLAAELGFIIVGLVDAYLLFGGLFSHGRTGGVRPSLQRLLRGPHRGPFRRQNPGTTPRRSPEVRDWTSETRARHLFRYRVRHRAQPGPKKDVSEIKHAKLWVTVKTKPHT